METKHININMSPSDIANLSNAYKTKVVSVVPVQRTIMQQEPEETEANETEAFEMAESDIEALIRDATSILGELKTCGNVEPWVASKITLASDYIDTVHKWMAHRTQSQAAQAPAPQMTQMSGVISI